LEAPLSPARSAGYARAPAGRGGGLGRPRPGGGGASSGGEGGLSPAARAPEGRRRGAGGRPRSFSRGAVQPGGRAFGGCSLGRVRARSEEARGGGGLVPAGPEGPSAGERAPPLAGSGLDPEGTRAHRGGAGRLG